MSKKHYLIKTEAGEQAFVRIDSYGAIYAYSDAVVVNERDFESILRELAKVEPREMVDGRGEKSLSLPSEWHRLSNINISKEEAIFTLEYVEVDFSTNQMTVLRKWNVDLKQWPEGHVKVEEVQPVYKPDRRAVQWVVDRLGALVSARMKKKKSKARGGADDVIAATAHYIKSEYESIPKELPLVKSETNEAA